MNPLSYYNKQYIPWTTDELSNIQKQYNEQGMNIIDIANIHYKTPGQVAYRLKKIGTVTNQNDIRGYKEYRSSDLFVEIMNQDPKEKQKSKQNQLHIRMTEQEEQMRLLADDVSRPLKSSDLRLSRAQIKIEINDLKKNVEQTQLDVKLIKKDVKEILRLINAIYDFESES